MMTMTVAMALPYPYCMEENDFLYMKEARSSEVEPGPPAVRRNGISKERKELFRTRIVLATTIFRIYGIRM